MRPEAFARPGRFYRGNLHCHSTRSDGALPPEEVCRRYREAGYDFVAVTDHFLGIYDYPVTDTRGCREPGFTTLIGAELHSGAQENGDLWHILAVGLPLDFAPSHSPDFWPVEGQESGPEVAARAAAAGAFVAIAHPQWSGLSLADARSISAAHAIEVYNHGCGVNYGRSEGHHTLEMLLSEGRRLNLAASDDAHFATPDHFGAWVQVRAAENAPEALLDALKAGAYYASQGPEITDIQLTATEVVVRCSAAASVYLQGHGQLALGQHGAGLTEARFPREGMAGSDWLRVTVTDAQGKSAWSNPIWP